MSIHITQLKPCGFCGGKATMQIDHVKNYFSVLCRECSRATNWYKTYSQAFKDWQSDKTFHETIELHNQDDMHKIFGLKHKSDE